MYNPKALVTVYARTFSITTAIIITAVIVPPIPFLPVSLRPSFPKNSFIYGALLSTESATVVNSDSEPEEDSAHGKIINESCKLKVSVNVALESRENRDRAEEESQSVIGRKKIVDKSYAEEGKDDRDSADSGRKLVLGESRNEESYGDEHHTHKKKRHKITEEDRKLELRIRDKEEEVKGREDCRATEYGVGCKELCKNHRGKRDGSCEYQLLGLGLSLFTEGLHRKKRKCYCTEDQHKGEVSGHVR